MTSKVLATSVKPIVASTIWVVFTLESARSSKVIVLSKIREVLMLESARSSLPRVLSVISEVVIVALDQSLEKIFPK